MTGPLSCNDLFNETYENRVPYGTVISDLLLVDLIRTAQDPQHRQIAQATGEDDEALAERARVVKAS